MILAIDIGGTAAKMGLYEKDGTLVARHEAGVAYDHYKTPIIDTIVREAEAFTRKHGVTPECVGVSATGQVDDVTGTVTGSDGKIPGYDGTDFRGALGSLFHVPVHALNDANAAALGECFMGAAKGCKNVLMVTLGTGVGGGIVVDGKLYNGTHGLAGEIGHFPLYADGAPCTCGRRGCFELYASTRTLSRSAGRMLGGEPSGR